MASRKGRTALLAHRLELQRGIRTSALGQVLVADSEVRRRKGRRYRREGIKIRTASGLQTMRSQTGPAQGQIPQVQKRTGMPPSRHTLPTARHARSGPRGPGASAVGPDLQLVVVAWGQEDLVRRGVAVCAGPTSSDFPIYRSSKTIDTASKVSILSMRK